MNADNNIVSCFVVVADVARGNDDDDNGGNIDQLRSNVDKSSRS